MRTSTRLTILVALAALAACGDELDVNNTDPRGAVGGILVDAITRQPIVGAQVTVLAGNEVKDADPTDETGAFGVDDVRAGDVIVTVTPPDGAAYWPAWIRDRLEPSAGEFPAGNTLTLGPIGLVPQGNAFALRVLDWNGGPVDGYTVTLRHFVEYVDFKSGLGESRGEVVMQATTSPEGVASFAGFPDFFGLGPEVNDTVVAHLPPLAGGAGYDYPGGAQLFNMRTLADPTPDVILDPAYTTSLAVRASTIQQLVTGLGPATHATVVEINSTVHVKFNLPIRDDARVTVSDELGAVLSAAPAVTISDDNIAVSFSNSPLMPGREYNIQIHATSAVSGLDTSYDGAASFFTAPISAEVTVANVTKLSEAAYRLEFSEPIGIGNGQGVSMAGFGECVAFFDWDIDAAGGIGNYPGERGNPSCWGGSNHYIYSAEPDPAGMPGYSGFTRFWEVLTPDFTAATYVDLIFSRVTSAGYVVERADGRVVSDFAGATAIPLPP